MRKALSPFAPRKVSKIAGRPKTPTAKVAISLREMKADPPIVEAHWIIDRPSAGFPLAERDGYFFLPTQRDAVRHSRPFAERKATMFLRTQARRRSDHEIRKPSSIKRKELVPPTMTIPAVATETLAPSSIDELAAMVRANNRGAIYPVGCGSWQDLGYPPTKPGVAISTKGLNRVVDYPHEELTITVEAGILISDLQRILAEKGQMLPIDCPHPENATLGGLLATNTSGPRRLAYGTARDSVLGLDVIDPTGTRIHGGGRVVKNVAGYDLPKMHIGALGTLGIIVEATLKVRPMAEKWLTVQCEMPANEMAAAFDAIRNSKLRPTAVEALMWEKADSFSLQIVFEDSREAVDFQLAEAESRLSLRERAPFRGAKSDSLGNLSSRLRVRPTSISATMFDLSKSFRAATLNAHAMNGIVDVAWDAGSLDDARENVAVIRRLTEEHGGRFSIPRCPAEWKRELPIWGDVGPEIEWMRRLRTALDPDRTLNPGRFVVE